MTRSLRFSALLGTAALSASFAQALWAETAAHDLPTPAVVHQDSLKDLSVVVGSSVLVDCSTPVERVSLGTGGFAEVTAISPTEVMVNGKAPGETTLILWEKGGSRKFFSVRVRASQVAWDDRLETVRHQLQQRLPGQAINVEGENGAVFLSGVAKDITSSDRAVQIASVAGKVVNLLEVEVPAPQPQILLKVVFASVDRSKSDQLGVNLFNTGFGNTFGSISTQQFSPPFVDSSGAKLSDDLNLMAYAPGLNLGATIRALENKGLVQVLAEPNVLAENGKQGSFLAGGEYPYPVVQGGAGSSAGPSITVQFKEYGIRLNFIPTILPGGDIRLQVAPEVSSLDFTNAVAIDGYQVPAVDVRRVKTEVHLTEGQSFAIGGLLDNRESETFQKIPFIGNVPVLGKLFQSISKTRSNTELIVIVTPEIVQPVPAGQKIPQPKYPTEFLPSNSSTPMQTPEGQPAPPQQSRGTVPVEKLIESMKPETPLSSGSDSGSGYSANGFAVQSGGASSGAPQ